MKDKNSELEFQTMFHMTYITVISILGILLMCVMMYSGWTYREFMCPIIGVAVLLCWIFHFFRIGAPNIRIVFFTVVALLGVLYYGSQMVSLTDVPITICLFIIILSAYQDIRLIYLMASSYPLLLLWHVFVTGYINKDTEATTISRIVLGAVSLLCAVFISRFFIKQQKRSILLQKKTEEELIRSRKENERFLINVSHELRTPINAVNGMSEIILHRQLDEGLKEEVQSIQNAGKRLYGQVSDILDYSELITNTLTVSNENYEIISVISDAVSNVQWQRMNEKLDVLIDIQSDIPKVLYGDAVKLKKIIIELMDNAVKFTESGGIYLYIGKRNEDYGINLNIDLWDTGIGMNEEQLKQLFVHFYKVDSDIERKTGGLGLGLVIVHGLITAMGGFISVKSEVGKGTYIHVSIPQRIVDGQSSIHIKNSNKFQIACYFNREKYTHSEVAEYYCTMVDHFRRSHGLNIRQADSLANLKDIIENNPITHVFVTNWEYDMDRDYFEELSSKIFIIVIADDSFSLPDNSNVYILRKPIYVLSVVNLLNATTPGTLNNNKREKAEDKLLFRNVKALVVDDDVMNLTVAKGILNTYGITSDTCLSGIIAIEKCMLDDYQIIFMDHMMPDMNGIVAMQNIRELRNGYYKKIPIVALTANAVSGAREMFLSEGFDEFISKPVELSAMAHVLRKMLAGGENTYE